MDGCGLDWWWMVSQTNNAFRLATTSADGLHWTLRRNCSVTPGQLAATFLALGALSLAVAVFFWFQGAVLVLPFALRQTKPELARWSLWAVLVLAAVMSLTQVLRGAHLLSHVAYSGWLCWACCVAADWVFRQLKIAELQAE